jgi:hypothetical protein
MLFFRARLIRNVRPRRNRREKRAMTARQVFGRAGLLALLTFVAIVLHECGHYTVYRLAAIPVRITLQSVHALGPVGPSLDHWALLAGPALSVAAAVGSLAAARRYPGFGWASAAFTNASLRLFPLGMDVGRAIRGGRAFSDEGVVAAVWATSPTGRCALLTVPLALCLVLTVQAGRAYRFGRYAALRVLGIYVLTVAIGIGVIILDELLV